VPPVLSQGQPIDALSSGADGGSGAALTSVIAKQY